MAIIGIDLGTTNSLASVWQGGKCVLIPNALGKYLTPSVVSVDGETMITGETAKHRLVSHPGETASLFKQFMGSAKTYTLGGQTFRPEELSAMLLRGLKRDAEVFLGTEITEAIISVPAYFNDTQRSATKAAGQLAGLRAERILNEPSAAALAYRQHDIQDGTNLVFDFGGGTLDISVVESFANIVDILAVSGDNHLGGSDIDAAIVAAFLQENPELASGLTKKHREILLKSAEACKISLSDRQEVFLVYQHGDRDYVMALDNQKLMQICAPILDRCKALLKRVLLNADITLGTIDNIILVGGSCRMPLIREYLAHLTQKPIRSEIDPDYAVAIGVGVAAGIKERDEDIRDMVLTDICPFSLGVRSRKDGQDVFDPIIPRNTALPASRVHAYTTLKNNQKRVDFEIYQGESLEAEKNLLLGRCSVAVPKLPAGEAHVTVRFSYDINGILDVEAHCVQNDEKANKVIVGNTYLSQEEIDRRLTELGKLKITPQADEENSLIIARGQRLYEEFSGLIQAEIVSKLILFQNELEGAANPAKIAKLRSLLHDYFDRLDDYSENLLFFGEAEPFDEMED